MTTQPILAGIGERKPNRIPIQLCREYEKRLPQTRSSLFIEFEVN